MNNQFNLSVKDYQIIKNASLSFLPGLNCIIGQSNNGKSALIRAAKSCIYNEAGTTSVRNGCSNFAVGIQANGHTVILQKGNNSLYKLDGATYEKIGRTQLKEVSDMLNIKELNLNGSNEQINFWDQMEKPFLLDRSETELFRFIVDSGKDNNITTALKTITQDRQQISRDITITEGKISQIEETLKNQENSLKDSDEKLKIYDRVIELGPKISAYNNITNLKYKFIEDNDLYLKNKNNLINISNYLDIVNSHIDNINNLNNKYNLINKIITNINNINSNLNNLKNKLSSIKSFGISDLNELLNKYNLLSNIITKLRDTSDELKELKSINFPNISLDFTKNIDLYVKISKLYENIFSKNIEIKDLRESIDNYSNKIESLNEEINKIGICPTCGQPLHINS